MPWLARALRPTVRSGTWHRWTRPIVACPRRCASSGVNAAELQFGQPVHETHPHVLKAGQLTPGISALEYFERRKKLSDLLPKDSVAILAGADIKYRSGAVFYEFRQDSDFYYLTGFNEPEAFAVIVKHNDEPVFHLFVRPKDPKSEIWEGARSGTQAALDVFNADEAKDISKLDKFLPDLVKGKRNIYTDLPQSLNPPTAFSRYCSSYPARPTEGISTLLRSANSIQPLRPLLNQLRAKKSDAEVGNMVTAAEASAKAYKEAMSQGWTREKDLMHFLGWRFCANGCDGNAYVPVIAGAQNALSIHYVRNDDVLRDGDLVLVDAGGEYGNYVTDITRTWPVNGRFSAAQKDLYQMILDVQTSCVSLCRYNANVTLDKLHTVAENGLRDGLARLGFDVARHGLDALFPHHVGHYLGLDIHDTPGLSRRTPLEPGHCITIEPGIYVPDDDRFPKAFRGTGIRIEDSICIGKEEPLVFTKNAVKKIADIEALRV